MNCRTPAASVGLALVLAVLLALALLFGSYWTKVSKQATKDEAREADVIVILGCAVWPGEKPSPSLEARVRHGVALYWQGLASHLILTGGLGRYPPTGAEVMRRLAVGEGIPAQAIILDTESRSTIESIRRAKLVTQEHAWSTAILVSDPFHMFRALMMAQEEGLQAWASPGLTSPTYTIPHLRYYYTLREVFAIAWYRLARLL